MTLRQAAIVPAAEAACSRLDAAVHRELGSTTLKEFSAAR
jgi:hypothetical protein